MSGREARKILDKHHRIPAFVIDQLVGDLFSQHDAESAGTQPHFVAHLNVVQRITGRIIQGGMKEIGNREAFAIVANVYQDDSIRADESDVDPAVRIEFTAMFNGIGKQLVQGKEKRFAKLNRQSIEMGPEYCGDVLFRMQGRRYCKGNPAGAIRPYQDRGAFTNDVPAAHYSL